MSSGLQIIATTESSLLPTTLIIPAETGTLNPTPGVVTYDAANSTLNIYNADSTITAIPTNAIQSLNALSGSLTFTTGTGSLGVTQNGQSLVFNIPDAGPTSTGMITTGSQTIAGNKTFTGNVSATVTNSIITDPTNTVTASAINNIYVIGSAPPAIGDILVCDSITTAKWKTIQNGNLTTLNTLTALDQLFATGNVGNDFNIISSSNTHTFNIPDASATARGVINTGTQTFAGNKTFSSPTTFNNVINSVLTDSTNVIAANNLHHLGGTISIVSSTPVSGDVLIATTATSAVWTTIAGTSVSSLATLDGIIQITGTPSAPQLGDLLIQQSPTTASWTPPTANIFRSVTSQNYWFTKTLQSGSFAYTSSGGNASKNMGDLGLSSTILSFDPFSLFGLFQSNFAEALVQSAGGPTTRNISIEFSGAISPNVPDMNATYNLQLFVNTNNSGFLPVAIVCQFSGNQFKNITTTSNRMQFYGSANTQLNLTLPNELRLNLEVTGSTDNTYIMNFFNCMVKYTILPQ